MAEAAAMELAVSSGLVGDGYQLVKRAVGNVRRSWDRARGLKLLKKLPTGLEALVYGEDDVTPELLAALSLGGRPGHQLSTIALLKANNVRSFLFPSRTIYFEQYDGWENDKNMKDFDVEGIDGETYLTTIFDEGCNLVAHSNSTKMDGDSHRFTLLGGESGLISVPPPDVSLSLARNAHVRVVGYVCRRFGNHKSERYCDRKDEKPYSDREVFGLLVETDGRHCYCENHGEGQLKISSVDVDIPDLLPSEFIVAPRVLENFSDFQRLLYILSVPQTDDGFVVNLLGLAKVAKELGEEFATRISGDGIPLLSKQHLRDVHNNPRRCTPTLKMPTEEELRTRIEEARKRMTFRDRDVELVLFSTMQEIISDYVKAVESEAARPGNVGVRPYKPKWESDLISSSIVQAVGMDATFAIFEGFRKHQLNIAVSPGCTAMYVPALSVTVAFPEGFEVQHRRTVLRPACPFSTDLQESLRILLDLAPKLAENSCREFAKTLSLELGKDPALALSPVTEGIVRALSPRGRAYDAFYLTDLFGYLKHNRGNTWGEASVAGILCQLGMTFSMPPRREGCEVEDFRCFFQVCREIWPSTCLGAELVVDCGVDISGCNVMPELVGKDRYDLFLFRRVPGNSESRYKLTGEVADAWYKLDELRECVGFLHDHGSYRHIPKSQSGTRIPVPCRVIGFGRPRKERAEEAMSEHLTAPVGRREVRRARIPVGGPPTVRREEEFCSLS